MALIVGVLAAAASAAPACALVDAETGERVTACVDADSNPAVPVVFARDIRPLMNGIPGGPKPCANCHYRDRGTREGLDETGLDLQTYELIMRGSSTKKVVIPNKPCESPIVRKLRGTGQGARMPKGGPYWSPEQIQLMTDWIKEGAVAGAQD